MFCNEGKFKKINVCLFSVKLYGNDKEWMRFLGVLICLRCKNIVLNGKSWL